MVIWGGTTAVGGYLNSGGQYNAVNNIWTGTTMMGAPSARYNHTAVWTGARMIVWGGSNDVRLHTGGHYAPIGDSWTATTTTGAPAPRDLHTAVWTGTRMIVWGGTSADTSGAQYGVLSLYVKN